MIAKLTLPTLRMASYLAFEKLRAQSEHRDGLVPVRVERMEPVVALSYGASLEPCELLMPEHWMLGEWPHLSTSYWAKLEALGADRIAAELRAISEEHGGKPLVLLDHDRPAKGNRTPRVTFAAWWEERTGEVVPELLDDGTTLHHTTFPKRTRPKKPKDWRLDRRWRDGVTVPWPPTEQDVAEWIGGRHWQTARRGDHAYTVRAWGPPEPFLRVVVWIREFGEREEFAGDVYWYARVGDHKYWSMGDVAEATIILNRKEWGADPQDSVEDDGQEPERVPRVGSGKPASEAPPLFEAKLDGERATLAERINREHRAASLAAGSAVRHALRCGQLLCEAKERARYGEWLDWLADNTDLAPRTAQTYMRLFRETTERAQNTQPIDAHLAAQEKERRSA